MMRINSFLIVFCTSCLSLFAHAQESLKDSLASNRDSERPCKRTRDLPSAGSSKSIYHDVGNETEIRIAYFYPRSPRFRAIFRGARLDYEVETSQRLPWHLWFWTNISWYPDSGHSIGTCYSDRTTIDLVPLSIGLKYLFRLHRSVNFYVGMGPVYYFLNTSNKSPFQCIIRHINRRDWGGVVKSQLQWFFIGCNYLDVFADYLYLPIHGSGDHASQAGGLKVGLGLGRHF